MPLSYRSRHTGEEIDSAIDGMEGKLDAAQTEAKIVETLKESESVKFQYNPETHSLTPSVTLENFNTDQLPEGQDNAYFTEERAVNAPLDGLSVQEGTVTQNDSVLSAIGKLAASSSNLVFEGGLQKNGSVVSVKPATDQGLYGDGSKTIKIRIDANGLVSEVIEENLVIDNIVIDGGNY